MARRRKDVVGKQGATGARTSRDRDRSRKRAGESTMDRLLELLAKAPTSPRQGLIGFLGGIVALDLSLADLVSIQSEKSEALTSRISTPMTPRELIEFEKAVAATLAEIVKIEELLLAKLRLVLARADEFDDEPPGEYFGWGDKGDEPSDDEIGAGK